jgi:hypothetical protein
MSLKRIRVYAKDVILIVLSMIVLAGASGLSYKAHYCNGNLSGIAFYTELGLQKAVSCGCENITTNDKQAASSDESGLKKKSCCSNISFFSKLSIESPTVYFSSLLLIQPSFIELSSDLSPLFTPENNCISVFDFRFRPPPLAGRKLVLFLSQQRIPFNSYNC